MNEQKSLKEMAQAYEAPAKTRNIADLDRVQTHLKIQTETNKNKEGEEFTINVITLEGIKYRVPNSVLNQLKVMLEDRPDLKEFKVRKTGHGLDTEYIVIPLH